MDLLSLMAPAQMMRNLLEKTRPARTLHFNLTFQRTGSMFPCFATPTWLLDALADVFCSSKSCNLAKRLGISIPNPSGVYTFTHWTCAFLISALPPLLPPFNTCPPLRSYCFVSWRQSSVDLTTANPGIPGISPESVSLLFAPMQYCFFLCICVLFVFLQNRTS